MPSMDDVRLDPVAASVAAWHNRQPLACRIGLAQVLSVGVVRLPFVAAAKGRPRPAFTEDFLPPWSARRIGRWVARHGQPVTGELADEVPRRDLATDPALVKAGDSIVTLLVRTAVIEVGGRQRRVLLGPGARPAVFGRAFLHRPRVGVAAGVAVAALALVGLLAPRWTARGPQAAVPAWSAASAAAALAAQAAASAASAAPMASAASAAAEPELASVAPGAAAASQAASAADGPAVAEAASAAGAMTVSDAASDAVTATAPRDESPRWGRVELPPRPVLMARRKAPAFGLASPVLRSEGESARVQGLMLRLVTTAGVEGVHIERLQVGDGWRIVGFPFRDRDSAERAALALVKGGLRTEVIDF